MVTLTSAGYLSDLSDAEWELVQPLLPPTAARGRPRQHSLRTILNAVFYLVQAGGASAPARPAAVADGVSLL
jgi:putative transposase